MTAKHRIILSLFGKYDETRGKVNKADASLLSKKYKKESIFRLKFFAQIVTSSCIVGCAVL